MTKPSASPEKAKAPAPAAKAKAGEEGGKGKGAAKGRAKVAIEEDDAFDDFPADGLPASATAAAAWLLMAGAYPWIFAGEGVLAHARTHTDASGPARRGRGRGRRRPGTREHVGRYVRG